MEKKYLPVFLLNPKYWLVEKKLEEKTKELDELKSIQQNRKENKKKIVEESEILHSKYLIKINLIKEKIPTQKFLQELFLNYSNEERISIKELSKLLIFYNRGRFNLTNEYSEMLARYLIESRDKAELDFNIYTDCLIPEITEKLNILFDVGYAFDTKELEESKNEIIKVIYLFISF